ncbi:MAG: ATP-binding protein, partial [Bacteroidota bacterium]
RSFNANGLPVNTGGDPTWSLNYYDEQLRQAGNDSSHYGLFFIGGSEGRMSYTAKTAVYDADTVSGIVVLSLTSKPLGGRSGFPELLLSGSVPQSKNVSDYSFAYYRNDTLINKSGDFAYPRLGMNVREGRSPADFFNQDGWSHLYHRTSENAFLLVSVPAKGVYQFSTVFSYLFGIYGFVFLLAYAIRFLIVNKWRWRPNIGARIRLSVVMIVVLTMLITGGATVWYIFNTYRADGGPETESRIRVLLGALQDEIGGRYNGVPLSGGDEMNSSLAGLAKALGADFNLYDPSGRLLYSSQPKLYDQQIVAPLINPDALYKLRSQSASFVSLRERIGTFEYLSSYVPLLEGSAVVKGYLNISYFSQQAELEQRVSGFLVAVVTLYVLLFALASFLTFWLSTRITQPLQAIREKLASVTFGKRNELLEWHSDDEIGELVKEYNRMATELSAAAEQLARSERESAWREMARQVAHEIKNPLTPMKLGLQHLQRAWRDNHPDKDQIMERMTKVLIEQIDALSNIATEFSGFAQMPQANKSQVNLQEILKSVVELYSEYENIRVVLIDQTANDLTIYADKEQLSRVFVNLVKNAVQAVNQDGGGLVEVVVTASDGWGLVEVRDNGSGIPDEQKPRIFTPNFTTKSGGTGLGLAICHQIVSQSGGDINFDSKTGVGTSFFVRLPLEKALA